MYPKRECLFNTNNVQRYEKFLTCARKMRKDRDFLFFFKNILWNEKKAVPLHADSQTTSVSRDKALFINSFLGG